MASSLFQLPNYSTSFQLSQSTGLGATAPTEGGLAVIPAGATPAIELPETIIDDKYRYVAIDVRFSARATYGAGATTRVWPAKWAFATITDLIVSGRSFGLTTWQNDGPVPSLRYIYEFRANDPVINYGGSGYSIQWGQTSAITVSAVAPDAGTGVINTDIFCYFFEDVD